MAPSALSASFPPPPLSSFFFFSFFPPISLILSHFPSPPFCHPIRFISSPKTYLFVASNGPFRNSISITPPFIPYYVNIFHNRLKPPYLSHYLKTPPSLSVATLKFSILPFCRHPFKNYPPFLSQPTDNPSSQYVATTLKIHPPFLSHLLENPPSLFVAICLFHLLPYLSPTAFSLYSQSVAT